MLTSRDSILNLLCASLQRNLLSVDDLKGVSAMFRARNVDAYVRSSALDLIVAALQMGIFSVKDLMQASRLADTGGPGFEGGGMGGTSTPPEQNVQFKDGDWICDECGNLNFARRTECHRENCKAPRPSRGGPSSWRGGSRGGQFTWRGSGRGSSFSSGRGSAGRQDSSNVPSRPGDWNCAKCGNLNFAFRTECHRNNCQEPRPPGDEGSVPGAARATAGGYGRAQGGDWNCEKCGYMNFARRTECNQCKEPRTGGNRRPPGNSGGNYGQARGDDWNCEKCGYMNFARRTECNQCKEPRSDGGEGSTGGGRYQPYGN